MYFIRFGFAFAVAVWLKWRLWKWTCTWTLW